MGDKPRRWSLSQKRGSLWLKQFSALTLGAALLLKNLATTYSSTDRKTIRIVTPTKTERTRTPSKNRANASLPHSSVLRTTRSANSPSPTSSKTPLPKKWPRWSSQNHSRSSFRTKIWSNTAIWFRKKILRQKMNSSTSSVRLPRAKWARSGSQQSDASPPSTSTTCPRARLSTARRKKARWFKDQTHPSTLRVTRDSTGTSMVKMQKKVRAPQRSAAQFLNHRATCLWDLNLNPEFRRAYNRNWWRRAIESSPTWRSCTTSQSAKKSASLSGSSNSAKMASI